MVILVMAHPCFCLHKPHIGFQIIAAFGGEEFR
jgi:hypothetical protein